MRHLYEDAYPHGATGPRRHEDWALDVLALMSRVPDPPGWAGLDGAARDHEREGFLAAAELGREAGSPEPFSHGAWFQSLAMTLSSA
ncbi:hypothetical protein ACFYP6_35720 [Streptomyces goshikiensis]|uniref:hypothetical protein n=1 Tax=Streptomyces goshikiensis TaxID=1942 RepID=UPI00368442FB